MSDYERIKKAFPGSRWVEESAEERRSRARAYFNVMWGDREGVIAIGIGLDPCIGKTDKYTHGRFTQRFFDWPAKADEALDEVFGRHVPAGSDVYVSPMLRASRERKKHSGVGGRWGWADLDGPLTPERVALLRPLGEDVIVVSSGTGHHVYFRLDDWYSPERVEAVNQALASMLGGDAKWSNESLLRLPGTYNHKPRVFDQQQPALVHGVTSWRD